MNDFVKKTGMTVAMAAVTTAAKTAAVLISITVSSCAFSKAIYLGDDIYSRKAGPQPADSGELINGIFPEAVYIKTRAQTFNAYHYYILNNGLIWYKSIDSGQEPGRWTLFEETGLPHDPWKPGFNKPEKIVGIAADADELVALSDEGGFYRYCFDKTIAHKSKVWLDRQGWPNEEQLFLDQRTARNRAWALGKRNGHVLYYEDPFGNQHHNGTMEIVTTYVLLEDGQEIRYADTGLPGDFSRNYTGPERGAFKAAALSASASTMFVINEAGEMYTRLADFDTIGCDPMFFKYTYTPYTSDLSGDNYFSNLNEWGLPAEGWRPQPPIPLSGKAAITRHITILQNGQGNGARELRVAGLNESGDTGYWTKAIFDEAWSFKRVPLYFGRGAVLRNAAAGGDSRGERGPSLDKAYRGYFWNDGEQEAGWEYAVPNFNILEGDCDLRITWRGETGALKLHPVEMWTYLKRDYLPGRTGSPKMFLVTLEIPENAFDGLSAEFAALLTEKYAKHDKKPFQYTLAASNRSLILRDSDTPEAALFLTDGETPDRYTSFRQTRLIEDFEEFRRYHSPELTIDPNGTPAHGDLLHKIELNKAFRDELKYQIRALKWSQLTAFKINAGYLPTHYSVLISPLRFVDVPKLRTVIQFGDRVVLENSSYVYTVSNVRIWGYERILELLEVRLRWYRELAKGLAGSDADAQERDISFPLWYAENISAYWDIAGLPRVIPGAFFNAGADSSRTQTPAVLSFVPSGAEPELLGWYFSIEAPGSPAKADKRISIFIDPLKSARTIYSRSGKTPAEKTVQLDGVLYFNPETASPIEQEVIDRMPKPASNETGRGVKVRIRFDGRVFEIKEYPAGKPNALIFRGEL